MCVCVCVRNEEGEYGKSVGTEGASATRKKTKPNRPVGFFVFFISFFFSRFFSSSIRLSFVFRFRGDDAVAKTPTPTPTTTTTTSTNTRRELK